MFLELEWGALYKRERERMCETEREREGGGRKTHREERKTEGEERERERVRGRERERGGEREREREGGREGGRESEREKNTCWAHIMLQNVQDAAWNETSHPKSVHVYLLSHQTIPAIQSNKDIHNSQSNHIFTPSLYLESYFTQLTEPAIGSSPIVYSKQYRISA